MTFASSVSKAVAERVVLVSYVLALAAFAWWATMLEVS